MDTNPGGVTAVEAWTGITVAARNVFTAKAVVDSLTADIHRQTVAVARTSEVGVGTKNCPRVVVLHRGHSVPEASRYAFASGMKSDGSGWGVSERFRLLVREEAPIFI